MFKRNLDNLKKQNLLRQILSRSSSQGPIISINGKKLINFSSNDYLGLSCHPEVIRAVNESIIKFGFGSGASRLLAGGSILHARLEKMVAQFESTESALIFNSGYSANMGIIQSLTSAPDLIFSDELNHASIIDGCRLSSAETIIYRHKDINHLESMMKKHRGRRKIVVTDTVFSMDGDIAPVCEIYKLCRSHSALLYLDDAHGVGVLGNGHGGLAHFNLKPEPWIIQMGTFSKAFGSYGAFAAGSKDMIQWLANSARSFLFSTALPTSIIAASLASLRLVKKNSYLRKRLWANRNMLFEGLSNAGFDVTGETPIIPVKTETVNCALKLAKFLFKMGIYAPAIRPPTVREPRVRITVSAAHDKEQIDRLLAAMKLWSKRG